jgi:UDP-N-acetylmuramoylalanine--D-glutamate ligase
MDEAVVQAYRGASPGDVVLLSPGCASFDMYTSYAHRGEVFRECVRGISQSRRER